LGNLSKEFTNAGAEILVILGDSLDKARMYAEVLHLPFQVLSDPQREIYHQYGLDRVIFGLQRTASVVVDKSGIVRYIKRTINTFEWLQESKQLLQFVQKLQG
jgi:peroxiredoxin